MNDNPLPWHAGHIGENSSVPSQRYRREVIFDRDGGQVLEIITPGPVGVKIAEQIVAAVNSFDAMREACKKAASQLSESAGLVGMPMLARFRKDHVAKMRDVAEQARAALAGLPAPAETVNGRLRAAFNVMRLTLVQTQAMMSRYLAVDGSWRPMTAANQRIVLDTTIDALALADKVTP